MNALRAVKKCREILRAFVYGRLDYSAFHAEMATAMAHFDPLDWALRELDDVTGKEASMYVEWLGGEFGETEDRIPRRLEWKYGECNEPYGWINHDEYRCRLREVFAEFLDKDT
jgi:hypothetical protein